MPSTTIGRGNALIDVVLGVQLTPTAIAANSDATVTALIPGALVGDYIDVFPPAAQTRNIVLIGCWISGANVMAVQFNNVSTAAVTPVSGIYSVNLVRPESLPLPANLA